MYAEIERQACHGRQQNNPQRQERQKLARRCMVSPKSIQSLFLFGAIDLHILFCASHSICFSSQRNRGIDWFYGFMLSQLQVCQAMVHFQWLQSCYQQYFLCHFWTHFHAFVFLENKTIARYDSHLFKFQIWLQYIFIIFPQLHQCGDEKGHYLFCIYLRHWNIK